MIKPGSSGKFTGAGALSAIAASLCCVTPVIALLAGSSSVAANFGWIEPARPYLIGISIIVLSLAWYIKLKPSGACNVDGNCDDTTKVSFLQSKSFLGIVTCFAVIMMTFPLYAKIFYPKARVPAISSLKKYSIQKVRFSIQGMTCAACEEHVNNELAKIDGVLAYETSYDGENSLVSFDGSKVGIAAIEKAINKTGYQVISHNVMKPSTKEVSFYEAPLVCHAAPSIGCGSKAKFLLADLEGNHKDAVDGAWLNKEGTVVAVQWNSNAIDESRKLNIIYTIGKQHSMALNILVPEKASIFRQTFPNKEVWFKGNEVDRLSKEEAEIIAKNTIEGYRKKGLIKPADEKRFQTDIAKIYTDLFLSILSYKDLSTEAYDRVETQIQAAGEKYVGKGKMPRVELCTSASNALSESCTKDQACSADGASCCEKS